MEHKLPTLGFIGTGTLAFALVTAAGSALAIWAALTM